MKLSVEQKDIVRACLLLIDNVNDADIIDDLNCVRHELDKDEPALTRFQCDFLLTVLSFWNHVYDRSEVNDLLKKLSSYRTVMTKLGSLLNNRIYGPNYDERFDPRKDSEFYDRLEPFVNAVADIFTKGEAWAEANECFIKLLAWADTQGWSIAFLFEWYHDLEHLSIDNTYERGNIFDFNSAVAQE